MDAAAINKADISGKTPLIRACVGGNIEMVKSLLAHKDIDVNIGDDSGNSALHFSSVHGHPDISKLLIEKGANVNYLDLTGSTPLNDACLHHKTTVGRIDSFSEENFIEGIKVLLHNGADPNMASANGWAPLHNACGYSGSETLIKTLVNAGADMNATDIIGITPLMVACQNGKLSSVKALLDMKVDIHAVGERKRTAFWTACASGQIECAQLLLEAGADIEMPIANGTRPLNIACEADQQNIVKFLIEHKADLDAKNAIGINAVMISSMKGHDECLRLMIEAGANVSDQDKDGHTALHLAVHENHAQCVKILMEAGADLSVNDNNGVTPLHLATGKNHTICVQLLLGQNPTIPVVPKEAKPKDQKQKLLKELERLTRELTEVLPAGLRRPSDLEAIKSMDAEMLAHAMDLFDPSELSFLGAASERPLVDMDSNITTSKAGLPDLANTQVMTTKERDRKTKSDLDSPLELKCDEPSESQKESLLLDDGLEISTVCQGTSESNVEMVHSKEMAGVSAQCHDVHIMDIAAAFIKDLNLSRAYFDPTYDVCFCEVCHVKRGDKLKYTRGNPPMDYGLPIGWCKFGLKLKPQAEAEDIFNEWHVAFHGTRVQNLHKILKNGDLLKPGDITFDGEELKIPPNHWDPKNPAMVPPPGHDVRKLYFSPSIKYSGCDCYAPIWCWKDPSSQQTHRIRVAFQVRIKPDVYKITRHTIPVKGQIDPLFSNEELEWSTNRFGVAMLVGLLVKIEGHTSDETLDKARAAVKEEPTLVQSVLDETRPVTLLEECSYKTPSGGHIIKLNTGDECLLLSRSEIECIIMHPNVDDPITLPISFIKL